MDLLSLVAIFVGAGIGALVRWALGLALNATVPSLPLGTLAANLVGGLLMGMAMVVFSQYEALPPAWRLGVVTGFLGGLTTFSTFSGETVTLLLRHQYGWTAAIIVVHTVGSILATLAGIGLMRLAVRA